CSSASSNPVDNQNEFSRYIVGQNLFVSIPANTATTSSTITVTESGYIYVYINKSSKAKTISVSSDSLNKKFENVNRGFILDLGWHEAGDTIELTCEEEGPMYVNAYRMDLDIFNQIYEELSRDQMIVDFYDNTTIKAHIDVTETGLLFTSIPADEGWTVTLNGEETEYREFGDALIAIPISETGYYEIEFYYTTPGFYTGLILSIISALFILLLFFLQHFLRQSIKIREKQQQIEINDTQRFLNELQDSLPAAEWEEILPQLNEQELALLQHPQNTESEDSVDNSDELKS
ncbi:MAG: YfhO family protein, partial [Lachnospiraceae bacterium]